MRIVNTFRLFYITKAGSNLDSSRATDVMAIDILQLEANPLVPFEDDPEALKRIAEEAAKRDRYARQMVHFSPPFLPKAVQALTDLARDRLGQESWLGTLNLWADQEVSHLMGCIVRHFTTLAKRSGSTPVLLFIPKNGEPRGDGPMPDYASFIEQLREQLPGTIVVDISRQSFDAERFLNVRYSGHPSPYGNRVIAEAVARAIRPVLH